MSVNSMAFAAISANIVIGFLAWMLHNDRKLLLPSFSEWRVIRRFGSQSSAASTLSAISIHIKDLALRKILGFACVALISRAQSAMNFFHRGIMAAVQGVMFPASAKAHRDGESVEAQYVQSVTIITACAWSFYGLAGLYAHELIRVMFGTQWGEAADLMPLFCLAGALTMLVVGGAIAALCWVAGVLFLDHPLKTEPAFQHMARYLPRQT
jgi:O-antigen/teichoic acid export membrane protein